MHPPEPDRRNQTGFKRIGVLGCARKIMLTDYIQAALGHAKYELMEDGRFYATIPPCRGVWAEGDTLEDCRAELQSTREDWLLLGLQLGHKLPVIGRINLNRKEPAYAKAS